MTSWLSSHMFMESKPKEEKEKEESAEVSDAPKEDNDETHVAPEPHPEASSDTSYDKRNIVAEWRVPLKGKLHKIEFEHGTTSGKRVLWINEQEVFRHDWMFKLVGDDLFHLEDVRCVVRVNPAPGFKYCYVLYVDGKPFQQFKECQAKALRTWETVVDDKQYRVVLEKDTLNIFMNGVLREEEGDFVNVGTETRWQEDGNSFVLSARTSGNKREGLVHSLTVNGNHVQELTITD